MAFTEPVAGYLAAAIGLQVLTPEGFQRAIEDGTDPAPADVATERDLLTGKKVRALLFNSQVITPLTPADPRPRGRRTASRWSGWPRRSLRNTRRTRTWQLAQMNELEQALAKGVVSR